MKTVWQGRMVQAASKYGEHAPMVGVCCNACRTCVSTNVISLALAAVGGTGIAAWAGVKRLAARSPRGGMGWLRFSRGGVVAVRQDTEANDVRP